MESAAEQVYSPSGRGPELIAVYSFFIVLTTVVIAARCYVRTFMVKSFGADDWAMLFGWAMFQCFAGFAIAGAFHGTGQHMDKIIPAWHIPIGLKDWWMCEPLYVICNMAVKLSIGLMLLRLVVEKSHKYAIYIAVGTIEIYSIVFFFLFVFQCIPAEFFWTRMAGATDGRCMSANIAVTATYIYSGISCIVDWTLAILPWFVVRKLQMSSRTKVMVTIVLAMGSIASTATIIRIPYVHELANIPDFLYATTDVAIWSCVETGLAIAASSAATLKPLIKKFLDRGRMGTYQSKNVSMPLNNKESWPRRAYARQSYVRTNSDGPDSFSRGEMDIQKTFEVSVSRE